MHSEIQIHGYKTVSYTVDTHHTKLHHTTPHHTETHTEIHSLVKTYFSVRERVGRDLMVLILEIAFIIL